ncbi:MAG TPA: UDP-N-acetylmuramoyl-L-alanyl-D-glutamate--2,6-diaminopimelate ligase [Gaiellaceae bacterium]|jgi:UDP-N-acetylmuramoyl-L-alanyl-D-glutamate--2,6-diaminopimelate ligase|nr:UDP-N-acetylmuramoyl-L-alanyl-D-glutamate--2,6-diaminopimelate ligase [Gaiellaceae bacterium]
MNLERFREALAPVETVDFAPVEVRELAHDARAVAPGSLFFCVPGSRADGHDFAPRAVAGGAVALVVERPLPLEVPQLVVHDVRAAMGPAAVLFFADPSRELPVAGITGTSGKTTTSYLLRAILEADGRRPGLLGSIERIVGGDRRPASLNTPEAIDLQRLLREMLDAGNGSCVLEATSIASAKGRLDGIRFAALVFTNLSQDHLDFHGTLDAYFEAKRRLFDRADRAAVNAGDEWGRRLARELPHDVLTFGAGGEVGPEALAGIDLKLRGGFNVENALAAVAAARLLGVGDDAIAAGLEAVEGVPGRFEPVDEGQPFAVIVDYAHKPGALENVLRSARGLARGRLVCVFGCGGDRDRGKRPQMGRIAAELSDRAILTSDNPRSEDPLAILEEVLAGAPQLEVEPDRRAAIELALAGAGEGDVVVIAGKGHEQGQEVAGVLHPFDDREVARETLRRLGARA